MSASSDAEFPMLDCPICYRQFGLAVGTNVLSPDNLPDPFRAVCIHCGARSAFEKRAIKLIGVRSNGGPC